MAGDCEERLALELSLLDSMYPELFVFDERAREVTYSHEGAMLKLRLPDGYLQTALPEVLIATTKSKTDLRDRLMKHIQQNCTPDEEVLDSIILAFDDIVGSVLSAEDELIMNKADGSDLPTAKACVIVWLHHLLNTNKRKQALSPADPGVCGVCRPGYPGVLIFSGPAIAVHQHVDGLKRLNWQAFQIRMDADEEWSFVHGTGIVEVEAMKDIVADIGEHRKQEFMEAMRMK